MHNPFSVINPGTINQLNAINLLLRAIVAAASFSAVSTIQCRSVVPQCSVGSVVP